MAHSITYIKKLEIKGLWNQFDLTWTLHPDVNVLAGNNGSGKTTILNCMQAVLDSNIKYNQYVKSIEKIEITFNNGKTRGQTYLKKIAANELEKVIDELKLFYKNDFLLEKRSVKKRLIQIDVVSTFDNEILEAGHKPHVEVRTELDRDIFRLQKAYLDYQLNIGKRKDEIVETAPEATVKTLIAQLRYPQKRFLEIVDNLFSPTHKRINRAKNEIMFQCGDTELTPYQLSSGEKQILVILLTVLVQDLRPAVLFMDEPEISLHYDWQKKLIQYIRELNPNVQIILATHSPALIMEGWLDKVAEISDLVTPVQTKKTG